MATRNTLRIADGSLVVTPRGLDRVWGFRRQIIVPLVLIVDAQVERRPYHVPMGWRGPGLDIGGKYCGTFHPNGERHYWNFSNTSEALMVEIQGGQPFDRLYLSVADAEAARQMISGALSDAGETLAI